VKEVFISTSTFAKYSKEPIDLLEREGYKVSLNPTGQKMTTDDIMKYGKDAVGLIAGTEKLNADVLKALPNLKVISRCGVGLDNVDLNAAEDLNIWVVNTPDGPTLAVAELTIGLILSLIRNVVWMDKDIRKGIWKKRMGNLLFNKRVGVIGCGRIGRKVVELLKVFNCEISYSDPYVDCEILGLKKMDLEELLKWSDLVTIHSSGSSVLINEKQLDLMKKGAWIVSVARGGVVDQRALYESLRSGYLGGAALDVFDEEPYSGMLKHLDNVILTPHVGSYAKEARVKMEIESAVNLINKLKDCL